MPALLRLGMSPPFTIGAAARQGHGKRRRGTRGVPVPSLSREEGAAVRAWALWMAALAVTVAAAACGGAGDAQAPVVSELRALLPAGSVLVPPPGASAAEPYLTLSLTASGARDFVALYTAGPPIHGAASGCNGRP